MKTIVTFLLLNFIVVSAAAQNLAWAKGMGANGDDAGNAIATDAAGNVYTTGHFEGTVDFDPGQGTYSLTSAGKKDVFVSKLDAAGDFQWAVAFGDTGIDRGISITTDASGNIYIAGIFIGTVDFDPGSGVSTSASLNGVAQFILKMDGSGNLTWARHILSPHFGQGPSLTTDAQGNVYTTGGFNGTVDFDPGNGIYNLFTSGGGCFVLKLDAAGNFVWARGYGAGPNGGSSITALDIAVDAAQNVYTAGRYFFTIDFDPSPATYSMTATNYSSDSYVTKLDANGNFVWVKAMPGPAMDICTSITLDAAANIYMCGLFRSNVDFDPNAGTYNLTAAGGEDAFVAKLDSAGSLIWAKAFGGTGYDGAFQVALDPIGNIYTTGLFDGTTDMDPGPSAYSFSTTGSYDVFVSKLDPDGNFMAAQRMGGTGMDFGTSLTIDAGGNILVTGYFNVTADLDPAPSVFSLTAAGGTDIFVVKLGSCTPAIATQPTNRARSRAPCSL